MGRATLTAARCPLPGLAVSHLRVVCTDVDAPQGEVLEAVALCFWHGVGPGEVLRVVGHWPVDLERAWGWLP